MIEFSLSVKAKKPQVPSSKCDTNLLKTLPLGLPRTARTGLGSNTLGAWLPGESGGVDPTSAFLTSEIVTA